MYNFESLNYKYLKLYFQNEASKILIIKFKTLLFWLIVMHRLPIIKAFFLTIFNALNLITLIKEVEILQI